MHRLEIPASIYVAGSVLVKLLVLSQGNQQLWFIWTAFD